MTDTQAIVQLILAGYTPRYVERVQARARNAKRGVVSVVGNEQTASIVLELADRWGIKQKTAARTLGGSNEH